MQRLEVKVVTENTARAIECDRLAARVIEDGQAVGPHREDHATVKEDRRKEVEPNAVFREEGRSFGDCLCEEDVHATRERGDKF